MLDDALQPSFTLTCKGSRRTPRIQPSISAVVKTAGLFILGAVCGVVAVTMQNAAAQIRRPARGEHGSVTPVSGARVHREETFAFKARGTMSDVAPLFGADWQKAVNAYLAKPNR
jgi:hypothetical protein